MPFSMVRLGKRSGSKPAARRWTSAEDDKQCNREARLVELGLKAKQ